jgi:hypothetical protein
MGHGDGPNLMSEGFFSARLNHLIDAGCIEASGPRTELRDYSVKLAKCLLMPATPRFPCSD